MLPATDAMAAMSGFDPQVLAAVKAGRPQPCGADYQPGSRCGYDTLREAAFMRNRYTCQIGGRGMQDGTALRMHPPDFRLQDRPDRLDNLLTVCQQFRTAGNHKPGR